MIVNLISWVRFAITFCNKIILRIECDNIVFDTRFNHAFNFYHALIALLLIIKFIFVVFYNYIYVVIKSNQINCKRCCLLLEQVIVKHNYVI